MLLTVLFMMVSVVIAGQRWLNKKVKFKGVVVCISTKMHDIHNNRWNA